MAKVANDTRRSPAGWLLVPLAGLCWLTSAASGRAQVDADPGKDYAVTPADGVWMICAASYMGDSAKQMAHSLVLEIRQRYHLPAFVFNRGDADRRAQQAEFDRETERERETLRQLGADPTTPVRHRIVHIEDQCAVLVGGYTDIDEARRALDHVRKLDPPKTVPTDKIRQFDASGKQVSEADVNPFMRTFVVHNPTVPTNKSAAADPFLKTLNAEEGYSLLRCKHGWTLLVKEYAGEMAVTPENSSGTPSFWEKVHNVFNADRGKQLDAAGHNAHNLAEVLHKMGFESYVLHTRHASFVAVGGFDSQDDPRMQTVRDALVGKLRVGIDQAAQKASLDQARAMAQLKLMDPPLPMQVPRP